MLELNQIYTGDARELAGGIEPESCSLAFTDPVYENVEDYEWLGLTAMRVLKPNSACLVWIKTSLHDECKAALAASGLSYLYTLFYTCSAKPSKPVHGGIFPWTTPCLLFAKGRVVARPYITDTYFSAASNYGAFKWNKNVGVSEKWLLSFSKPDDLVFDPFAGSGTVPAVCRANQRNYIAFEIDSDRAQEARRRVEYYPIKPLFSGMSQTRSEHLIVEG